LDLFYGIAAGVAVSALVYVGFEIKMMARDIHIISKFIENPPPIELSTRMGGHAPGDCETKSPHMANYL